MTELERLQSEAREKFGKCEDNLDGAIERAFQAGKDVAVDYIAAHSNA